MTARFLHLFFAPGAALARGDHAAALARALESSGRHITWGPNGAYVDGDAIELVRAEPTGAAPGEYPFGHGTSAQRARSAVSDGAPATVLAIVDRGAVDLYYRVHHTVRGVLYLRYQGEPAPEGELCMDALRACLARAEPRWHAVRALLGDECAYSKWRSDLEMERKYTFRGIPDTWRLIRDLYRAVRGGALPGFVPELDRDFQVFDYESHIFAVEGEPSDRGYISFIPQANGRTTVKRKWFTRNAEIRRESLYPDLDISPDAYSRKAQELANAPVVALPTFRRKRFDVNFESVETGNVYGIYFDICRIVERPAHAFAQCEVEYCRSRTFEPLRGVTEEFEQVAKFTSDFLAAQGVPFQHDLYSKLDFVREAAQQMEAC